MFKKFISGLLVFSFSIATYSQNKNQPDLVELYERYYQIQPETIFTHLNKSNYIHGETLWFKSYVYFNKELKPYLSTTNIYVNIYDQLGKMVDQKLFKCADGFLSGQIKIDEKFDSGVYYIKTTTNWMRNFDLDNSDVKKFVVNSDIERISNNQNFNFDIIPEGGTLIFNANNSIGIKMDLKKGIDFNSLKGVVTDNSKNVLTVFKLNSYGIGKFNAQLNKNNNYFVTIYENEREINSRKIENIKNSGVNLKLLHRPNNLNIIIETNEETLTQINGKTFQLYVHRDGQISSIPVAFKKGVKTYSFIIPKSELLKGINIFTLVDDNNNLLLERMVFNELNLNNDQIEILEIVKGKDSSIVKLKTNINTDVKNSFSISVIPETNKDFNYKENIKSNFLLLPYLKKHESGLNSYLDKMDKKSLYDLDLLLITQGNSRQSLDNIINKTQIARYNFDTGFQIKGKLNKTEYKTGNYIELISTDNAISAKSNLNKLNEFSFENIYLGKETEINFFLKNKKGKSLKITPYYNIYPKPYIDSINVKQFSRKSDKSEIKPITLNRNFIIPENVTELNEIELGLIKEKKITKNKPLGSISGNQITFSDKDLQTQLITDIIRNNGFDVYNNGTTVRIKSRRVLSFSGAFAPAVFIDNIDLGGNFNVLTDLMVSDVEEMYITKISSIYGSRGAGGVINIYTKKGASKKRMAMYKTYGVNFGFELQETYKSPNYISTSSPFFSKLGVINWFPNAETDVNGTLTFKVPNYYNEKMKVYINGMDQNGLLYSAIKTISLQ